MPSWVVRALGMAVLHAAAIVALAKIVVFRPTDATFIQAVVLALLVGAAALWGALDAWLGKGEGGRTWFIAALVAGPLAGVLGVIGRSVFVDQTGLNQLGSALTGDAAFTALLVLLPAGLGLFVGGKLAGSHRTDDAGPDDRQQARETTADDHEDANGSGGSGDSGDSDGSADTGTASATPTTPKPRPYRHPRPQRRQKPRPSVGPTG